MYNIVNTNKSRRAIVELARYLIVECGFNYILLALIQSDNIEARFGWFCQLSGANSYYISWKQLTATEKLDQFRC